MKKIIKTRYVSILITICLLLGTTSVLATDRFEGLSNKEINKILMDELVKETEAEKVDIYDFDEDELNVQKVADKTGLHRNQVAELLSKGYSEKEVLSMDLDTADKILTKDMSSDELVMYYFHVAPRPLSKIAGKLPTDYIHQEHSLTSGYCDICCYTPDPAVNWTHIDATEGYNASGCFHEDCGLTSSNVNTACYRAKLCGFNIYDLTSSTNLNFDYYMFGENHSETNNDWAHEGVDINYTGTSGRDVYAPITGHVHWKDSSTIVIHPDSGSYSVNVQHLDNAIADGEQVIKGETKIGDEGVGSGENHTHIGVCTHNGNNCTTIHSGQDLTLNCVAPYTYID